MALIESVLKEFNDKIRQLNNRIQEIEKKRGELYRKAMNPPKGLNTCEIMTDEYSTISPYAVGVPKDFSGKDVNHLICRSLSEQDSQLVNELRSAKEQKEQLRQDLDFQLQKLGFNSEQAAAAAAEALSTVEKETESEKKYQQTVRLIVKLTGIGLVILIFYYVFTKLTKTKNK